MRVVIALLAVWVAAGLAYLLFDFVRSSGTGSVVVLSDPPGAEIFVDLQSTGTTTSGIVDNIKRGRHSVTVKLPNHLTQPFTQIVDVKHGTLDTLKFTLSYVEGGLPTELSNRTSFPDRSPEVLPKELTINELGRADSSRVRRSFHSDTSQARSQAEKPTLPVRESETQAHVPAPVVEEPEADMATIEVSSSVPGAKVMVNGRELSSTTPVDLTLPFGTYTVSASLEGFTSDPSEQVVRVGRAASTQFVFFTMKPDVERNILIQTSPVSGKIFVDSVLVGEGNVTVPHEFGIYNIAFGAVDGYRAPDPVRLSITPSKPNPEVAGVYTKLLEASVQADGMTIVNSRGDVSFDVGIFFDETGYQATSSGPRIREIPNSSRFGWELAMGDANRNPQGADYFEFRFKLPDGYNIDEAPNLRLYLYRSPRRYPLSLGGKSEMVVAVNGKTFLNGFTPRFTTDSADMERYEEWSLVKMLVPGENKVVIRSGSDNVVYHYLWKVEIR